MEQKSKRKKYIVYAISVLLLLTMVFGGFKSGKYRADRFWKREIEQRNTKITESKQKQDSISTLVFEYQNQANEYESLWMETQRRNNILYGTIQRQKKLLDRNNRDTVFIDNARIISRSVDRYYKEQDSIR